MRLLLLLLIVSGKVGRMIDKYITSQTYYTFNGQEWPKFNTIEGVKDYAKKRIASSVKDVMGTLNQKVSRQRNVDCAYQTAHRFINELSLYDMLEIRREINCQERQIKKLDKLS